ncbi:tRNA (adenosine(37)-N6)-dimethylallyltransferase MiaA [Arthrobacter sp. Bz4]|uniref:tRNA (adenosine(37)-N6)-dimethylallyltransferase MiaA n=1 Tax=Arthrobacter sp. Bz4 TaxID=2171979 RepID=UPI000D51A2D7|nr:tRNA (adenosine(37)-N6)-dimethylallyltransferase MiaA [Arthrobacter sp. Bz4]PVE17323.1 tRNA (adenosine(37)-N6)-dimethylallyltransferase MiaA [Arthrobacter sp. Bz4]
MLPAAPASPPLIAVVGPTGSGKSSLGIELARRFNGEIINADSMQFYRGMDIGTAKVSLDERQGIPHHLLDTLDVREEASVAAYQQQARTAIDAIRDRGRMPILVGGSGLYIRAALDVLEFPGTEPGIRAQLEADLARDGADLLRERLAAVDPISAGRDLDDRRLIRALEVYEVTGRPFSSFMPQRLYHQPALQLGLRVDRPVLRERLATRVHTMVDDGLLDEVARLDRQGLRSGRTASRALGYAQFLQVLDGELTTEQAASDTIDATRRFARRQLTWFRADPRITWLDWEDPLLGSRAADHLQQTFGLS